MKVVLIYPPHPYLSEETQQPCLGLLYLASILEKEGYDVEYVSLAGLKKEQCIQNIPHGDIYGIHVAYLDVDICDYIATCLKRDREATVVMGGIHPTTLPLSVDYAKWDTIVIGEGERAILELLRDFSKCNLKQSYQAPFIENLDELPFPARHLLQEQGGKTCFSKKGVYFDGGTTSIISSRGCPYGCAFCGSMSMWHRHVRYRSPTNVFTEIKQVIKEYGIRQFRFQDDTVTLDKQRLSELCHLMQQDRIAFHCTTRTDVINDEVLSKLVQAGCKEIGFGVESADQRVLDVLGKGTTVEQNLSAIRMAKKYGLVVRMLFMMGTPGERLETPQKNIDFLKKARPDIASLMLFAPFPGSDIWNHPERYGIDILSKDLRQYTITSHPLTIRAPLVAIDGLTLDEQNENITRVREYLLENKLMHFG
jgi:anaerobic magnesium-protoporphyrin IX monomethyl ester cyclase